MAASTNKLFLLVGLDSRSLQDLHYFQSVEAKLVWAASAVDAATGAMASPWLLHAALSRTPRSVVVIDKRWAPFLTPSPWHIELFIHEVEIEDMRLRVGSGQTATRAELFLPPAALDALKRNVLAHCPHFDLKKKWCFAFDSEPFEFPVSRMVPPHRPISDCWVKRIRTPTIELTLVEAAAPLRETDLVPSKNIVLGSWQLHAQANIA